MSIPRSNHWCHIHTYVSFLIDAINIVASFSSIRNATREVDHKIYRTDSKLRWELKDCVDSLLLLSIEVVLEQRVWITNRVIEMQLFSAFFNLFLFFLIIMLLSKYIQYIIFSFVFVHENLVILKFNTDIIHYSSTNFLFIHSNLR